MRVPFVILLLLALKLTRSSPLPIDDLSKQLNRIVNGFVIDISQVPYHASVIRKYNSGWVYTCGASIITARALLTAAHCVKMSESSPSSFRVTVGTSSRSSGGYTYDLSNIYIHESYSSVSLVDDIAMLVTNNQMSLGTKIYPINFAQPSINIPIGKTALVSGFGMTSYEGAVSSILLAANVEVVSQTACANAYRRIATISPGMLCASANSPPRDACQGDSGGPLVMDNILIGIVSWGEGCGNASYPGVYTRVSEYYTWVMSKLVLV